MAYRDTASFGKRQEYVVVAELLKREFDVYMTLVDDQGIDCVIRLDSKRYLDIQIKARSKTAKQWYTFAAMTVPVRSNYYFIFYLEKNESLWTIPARDVKKLGHTNKSGKNEGKTLLNLPSRLDGEKYQRFSKYEGEAGLSTLRRWKATR
jgi:hypothetical protein